MRSVLETSLILGDTLLSRQGIIIVYDLRDISKLKGNDVDALECADCFLALAFQQEPLKTKQDVPAAPKVESPKPNTELRGKAMGSCE